nr:DNA adenine methylase [Mycoplasmopsis bovis]
MNKSTLLSTQTHYLLFLSINNDRVNIKSRRYLGAKTKLLYFIYHAIKDKLNDIDTFADIFGGTGVVSYMFQQLNKKIIINDILESNFSVL